ncbi:MAG: four helix bundle protein [Patescibacteria group bacterium]
MTKIQNPKQYDLEDRTYLFAKHCRDFISRLPKMTVNFEYGKQLARSAGSQAANYIEANESISRKDFLLRLKICRKEAKESRLWLRLAEVGNDAASNKTKNELIQEAMELTRIFGAILEKSK